jgi:hypothetical protein
MALARNLPFIVFARLASAAWCHADTDCRREEFMSEGWDSDTQVAGVRMRHAATRSLYAYWNLLRGGRAAPERREIEPAAIGRNLSFTFILEADGGDTYPYRLAGTHVCSLFGRELKGADWLADWSPDERPCLASLMRTVVDDAAGAVILFTGRSGRDQVVPLETVLLPLVHRGAGFRRVLGATAPLDKPYWLGARPLVETRITRVGMLAPPQSVTDETDNQSPLNDPALPVRRLGHLAVYEGGRVE